MKRLRNSVFVCILFLFLFLPTTALASIDVPVINQLDSRWDYLQYAHNPNITIGGYGCALTSMAMILNYYGFPVDPPTLNYWMVQNGGYDYDLVYWNTIPRYTNGIVQQVYNTDIDNELSQNRPVIAQVYTRVIPMHFIVITGRNGGDYEINDPLGGLKTTIGARGYSISKDRNGKLIFIFYHGPTSPPQPPKPTPPSEIKIKPQKEKKKAVVILVNSYQTMAPFSNQLKQQAKLIVDMIENDTALSFFTFTNMAEGISYEPIMIRDDQDREKIKRRIDEVLDPFRIKLFSMLTGVDHDRAIQDIIHPLEEPGIRNRDRIVYLLTDGYQERNVPEGLVKGPELEYENSHRKLKEKGIKLRIIGIGNVNQELLQRIAEESGGKFETIQKDRKLPLLLIPWLEKEVRFEKLVHLMLHQVVEDEFEIPYQDYWTIFSLLWDHTELEITVTDPSGKEITTESDNSDITLIQDPTYILYKIKTPIPGKYKIKVKAIEVPPEGEDIQILAVSQVDRTPPKIKLVKPRKIYRKTPISLKIKVSDNITKITNIQIRYKSKKQSWKRLPAKKDGEFWKSKWEPKKNGNYTLGIVAFDQFGNTATLQKEVKVNILQPEKKSLSLLERILIFLKKISKFIGLS